MFCNVDNSINISYCYFVFLKYVLFHIMTCTANKSTIQLLKWAIECVDSFDFVGLKVTIYRSIEGSECEDFAFINFKPNYISMHLAVRHA